MLQVEREYARRFPERTKAAALRTRKAPGARQGSRPAGNRLRFEVPGPGLHICEDCRRVNP
jgi:hypothetical protein